MMSPMVWGALGGLLPDAIRLIRSRHDPEIPAYLKSPVFYTGLGLSILLGAMTAQLLQAHDVLQALAYGFAAPEILTRVLAGRLRSRPEVATLAVHPPMTMRDWWQR